MTNTAQVLDVMTPFMMVRHPFTRLVSAYEDKMLNPKPLLDYHKTVQKEIKSRRMRLKLKTRNFTFPSHLLETEKFQLMLKRKVKQIKRFPSLDWKIFRLQQWKNYNLNLLLRSLCLGCWKQGQTSLGALIHGPWKNLSVHSSQFVLFVKSTTKLSS